MAKLKVPSLQHLARNWRENPQSIKRVLVNLADSSPTFNYNPLFSAVRDLLVLGIPYEQVVEGIKRGVKRPAVQSNFLGVLPLINEHFEDVSPTFVQGVTRRWYPIGRGLAVPFDPPLIYGVGGQIVFPWFSFWRLNPLNNERLSLFVTLVEEVLLQDPDLDSAKFEIVDFSAPNSKSERELRVINAREIPRVSDARKAEMLEGFAEGFFLALEELAGRGPKPPPPGGGDSADPDQPGFFD